MLIPDIANDKTLLYLLPKITMFGKSLLERKNLKYNSK